MRLLLLAIISMSPLYIYKVYKKSIVFIEAKEFKLKKYKIDSLKVYSSGNWGSPSTYYVFFDNKKKIRIPILDKNHTSFSKRVNKVYKHFNANTLKNYYSNREVLKNDSIYVWESTSVNKYGFKNEKEIDLSYDKKSLVFNSFLLLITFFSAFYFIKIEIKKRKENGNNRKDRKLQKQLKKKEQMEYLLDKINNKKH